MTDTLIANGEAHTSTDIDHFACCDAAVGQVEPMLCGIIEVVDGIFADSVACVVCNDLAARDVCPRYGACPYERITPP